MNRRAILYICLFVVVLLPRVYSGAQQPKKVARVCYFGSGATESAIYLQPFHKRLRDLGYIEGQSVTFEYRYFEGKIDRLRRLPPS